MSIYLNNTIGILLTAELITSTLAATDLKATKMRQTREDQPPDLETARNTLPAVLRVGSADLHVQISKFESSNVFRVTMRRKVRRSNLARALGHLQALTQFEI